MRKRVIIIGIILLVLVSSGCTSLLEPSYKIICSTGEKVSDPSMCPEVTTAPPTTTSAPITTTPPTTTTASPTTTPPLTTTLPSTTEATAPTITSAPVKEEETTTDVQALFESKCSDCHSINRPKSKRKTRSEWEITVKRMQDVNGAREKAGLTDEEAEKIIDYLAETYGE
ncbi:MAG: hypothetical protein V3R82_03200 [Candidatus Hydrothermarchaeales archaeon]